MGTAAEYSTLARDVARQQFGDTPAADVFYRMMSQESMAFNPEVVEGRRDSPAGARGIAQLMPVHWKAVDPLNPRKALEYGAGYLKSNLARYGGDLAKATAAYNAGPGNIDAAIVAGGANWQAKIPNETKTYLAVTKAAGTVDPASIGAGANASTPRQAAAITGSNRQPSSGMQILLSMLAAPRTTTATAPGQTSMTAAAPAGSRVFPVQGYKGDIPLHWGEDSGAADLFAPAGTPIRAMSGGKVLSSSWSDIGGWNVTVQGSDGLTYYYAHMKDKPLVLAGQTISTGTQLGGVGDTGNAKGKGTHLHLGIGPEIQSGVGPTGGSGKNYNANSLLKATLASEGTSGGANMVTQQSQTGGDPTLRGAANDERARYDKLVKEQADILAAQGRGELKPDDTRNIRLSNLPGEINAALGNYIKLSTELRQGQTPPTDPIATAGAQSSLIGGIAALQRQAHQDDLELAKAISDATGVDADSALKLVQAQTGAAQTDFTNRISLAELNDKMIQAGFGNELDLTKLFVSLFEGNRQDALASVVSRQSQGSLNLEGIAAQRDLINTAQASQLAYATEGLARAGYISQQRWALATRLLPEGTDYQPGFEPNSPMNQVFKKLGMDPYTIRANKVDVSLLDPERVLSDADAGMQRAGITKPTSAGDFGALGQSLQRTVDENRAIVPYNSQPLTPDDPRLKVPTAPNAQDAIGKLPGAPDVQTGLNGLTAPTTVGAFTGLSTPDNSTAIGGLQGLLAGFQNQGEPPKVPDTFGPNPNQAQTDLLPGVGMPAAPARTPASAAPLAASASASVQQQAPNASQGATTLQGAAFSPGTTNPTRPQPAPVGPSPAPANPLFSSAPLSSALSPTGGMAQQPAPSNFPAGSVVDGNDIVLPRGIRLRGAAGLQQGIGPMIPAPHPGGASVTAPLSSAPLLNPFVGAR